MDFGFQETSAAAAAIKALQIQLKDLRQQNLKLQNDLNEVSYTQASSRDSFDQKLESLKTEYFSKESAMKQDILYLCERVKQLEQENISLISENNSYKQETLESRQSQRMVIILQEELQILSKKLVQKETENDLLSKRISQLEEQGLRNSKHFESFVKVENTGKYEKFSPDQAELIDSELSQQKVMYREYLKNPNPSSQEWKNKVDQLRSSINSNSLELLKLRKDQNEKLRGQLGNE